MPNPTPLPPRPVTPEEVPDDVADLISEWSTSETMTTLGTVAAILNHPWTRQRLGDADTKRLDWLEADALNEALTLHDGTLPIKERMQTRGLGFGPLMGRSLRDALDTAMQCRSLCPPTPPSPEETPR